MFNKLRIKLALTNAAVAAVILLAICGAAYLFIDRIVTNQSEQDIRTVTRDLMNTNYFVMPNPDGTIRFVGGMRPYFLIGISSGEMRLVNFGTDLTEQQMKDLVVQALVLEQQHSGPGDQGDAPQGLSAWLPHSGNVVRLSDGHSFRYRIAGMYAGSASYYLIFMDMRAEEALLGSVRIALLGTVLGGMLLTLLGGMFLAGRALRPIRAAWQKQREFVADASHELRSPLAAIRCSLDVVLDDPAAPVADKQPYWEGIVEETDRMAKLVDELLLLARADSGGVAMQKEKVQLSDVAEAAIAVMGPMAVKKGVSLNSEIEDRPAAEGDPARLKQVLIALVDNAVKYTPEGGSVAVTVRRAKDKAVITVADTGIGIEKQHLDKIFDRFYRVDTARGRESGGHGLGLSIAHWIVRQHGGGITVASEPGRGSAFTVTLPLMKEPE